MYDNKAWVEPYICLLFVWQWGLGGLTYTYLYPHAGTHANYSHLHSCTSPLLANYSDLSYFLSEWRCTTHFKKHLQKQRQTSWHHKCVHGTSLISSQIPLPPNKLFARTLLVMMSDLQELYYTNKSLIAVFYNNNNNKQKQKRKKKTKKKNEAKGTGKTAFSGILKRYRWRTLWGLILSLFTTLELLWKPCCREMNIHVRTTHNNNNNNDKTGSRLIVTITRLIPPTTNKETNDKSMSFLCEYWFIILNGNGLFLLLIELKILLVYMFSLKLLVSATFSSAKPNRVQPQSELFDLYKLLYAPVRFLQ